MRALEHEEPDQQAVQAAELALSQIKLYLAAHAHEQQVKLVVDDDHDHDHAELVVPRPAVELLAQILAHMAAGRGVSVVPAHAELTTQQAADLLNVSRPFLIGLLDAGEIEYRLVGKHRRVRADSLISYTRADDRRRREAADDLTTMSQDAGLV